MITEKYVSFETAKLLKKKGFNCDKQSISAMYDEDGDFCPLLTTSELGGYDYEDFDDKDFIAPTLQMAMDWLRTTHNLHICFRPVIPDKEIEYRAYIFDGNCEPVLSNEFGGSPGYCADMAIKYCLENLIK